MLFQGQAAQLRVGQLAAHLFLIFLAVLLRFEPRFNNALLYPAAFTGVLRQILLHLG